MTDIDKRLLVDTVTIQKPTGEIDGWGKLTLDALITLKPVRFDRQYQTQGTQNNRTASKPSVLFVNPKERKRTRLNSSHDGLSRKPSSA